VSRRSCGFREGRTPLRSRGRSKCYLLRNHATPWTTAARGNDCHLAPIRLETCVQRSPPYPAFVFLGTCLQLRGYDSTSISSSPPPTRPSSAHADKQQQNQINKKLRQKKLLALRGGQLRDRYCAFLPPQYLTSIMSNVLARIDSFFIT
jgi:hypothetical protein